MRGKNTVEQYAFKSSFIKPYSVLLQLMCDLFHAQQ